MPPAGHPSRPSRPSFHPISSITTDTTGMHDPSQPSKPEVGTPLPSQAYLEPPAPSDTTAEAMKPEQTSTISHNDSKVYGGVHDPDVGQKSDHHSPGASFPNKAPLQPLSRPVDGIFRNDYGALDSPKTPGQHRYQLASPDPHRSPIPNVTKTSPSFHDDAPVYNKRPLTLYSAPQSEPYNRAARARPPQSFLDFSGDATEIIG